MPSHSFIHSRNATHRPQQAVVLLPWLSMVNQASHTENQGTMEGKAQGACGDDEPGVWRGDWPNQGPPSRESLTLCLRKTGARPDPTARLEGARPAFSHLTHAPLHASHPVPATGKPVAKVEAGSWGALPIPLLMGHRDKDASDKTGCLHPVLSYHIWST